MPDMTVHWKVIKGQAEMEEATHVTISKEWFNEMLLRWMTSEAKPAHSVMCPHCKTVRNFKDPGAASHWECPECNQMLPGLELL